MIVTVIVEIEKSGDYLIDSFNVCTSSTIYSYSILSILSIYPVVIGMNRPNKYTKRSKVKGLRGG